MEILRGYTTQATAYEVKDYPYGFRLRTSIFYWIESKKGNGDRFCSYTINPKTGRANAPKCGTYSVFQYMFINDKGHVENAGIDSYDIEYFRMRFYFIVDKFGEIYMSQEQKDNIRKNHFDHVRASYPYHLVKYTEGQKEVYKKWAVDTINHIKTCPFKDLVDYPEPPTEDNPSGEIKMIVRERTEQPAPALPAHTITVEKVEGILKKTLPGFYIHVSESKGTFGGAYMRIAMAVRDTNINNVAGQKVQLCSLSLDLKTLELNTQVYGGNGGGAIYRQPNREDAKERFLAMKSVKIPFRRPACNEKEVLSAIERFAGNYKNALIENKDVLMYQEIVNYNELLTQPV